MGRQSILDRMVTGIPLELNLLFISSRTQFRWFGLFQNIRTLPQLQNFIVYIHAMILPWFPFMRHDHMGRAAESGFAPSSKGGLAKNLYTKSEKLTPTCRVTRAWSETVNLYNILTHRLVHFWCVHHNVIGIFHRFNPFGLNMAFGSTQSVTEMSTGGISWAIKAAGV
jgi:hypothetical protein